MAMIFVKNNEKEDLSYQKSGLLIKELKQCESDTGVNE